MFRHLLITALITLSPMANADTISDHFHVQAHRGACAEMMENTLPSFERAIELGADSVELDIHLTRDGSLVVYHDFALNPKFTQLTDGSRLKTPLLLHELTLAQLKAVDILETTRLKYANHLSPEQRRIPTLEEVFALFRDSKHPNAGRMVIDIEVKSDPRHPRYAAAPTTLARRLLTSIEKNWDFDRVVVRSFDHRVLAEARAIRAELKIAALTDRYFVNYGKLAESLRPNIIAPPANYSVYSWWLNDLHRRGIRIMPYTANTPAEWKALIKLGVDGITTDDPRGLIAYLETNQLRDLPLPHFRERLRSSGSSFWSRMRWPR